MVPRTRIVFAFSPLQAWPRGRLASEEDKRTRGGAVEFSSLIGGSVGSRQGFSVEFDRGSLRITGGIRKVRKFFGSFSFGIPSTPSSRNAGVTMRRPLVELGRAILVRTISTPVELLPQRNRCQNSSPCRKQDR